MHIFTKPLNFHEKHIVRWHCRDASTRCDEPVCTGNAAVVEFKLGVLFVRESCAGRTVKPYILDLESANGTFLNNKRIEARRYYEMKEKDVVKFGYSSREYVLLHEGSKDDEAEEDAGVPDLSPVSLLRQK
ncbi:unnamed protein product, partial [Meganyctiphanes norvegica]